MNISKDDLAKISDDVVVDLTHRLPKAELYELGSLLISIGCFITASAIPELWPRLKPTAELSHELLFQKEIKQKLNIP